MEKIGLDLYSCQNAFLDNEKEMLCICDKIAKSLGVELFVKPAIIPYFYGKVKMDDGISCVGIFRENSSTGFFTIHTFSKRKIVYFDLCSKKHFDRTYVQNLLAEIFQTNDLVAGGGFDGTQTWGIQFCTSLRLQHDVTFNDLYNLTNKVISEINMTKISNTIIEKTNVSLIAITLIAESHIAFIYNQKTKELFVDVFSCKFFDANIVKKILEKFCGCKCQYIFNSRGVKHSQILQQWTLKADFDEYDSIFVIWPSNTETWRKQAKPAKKTFKKLIKTIAKYEKVIVALNPCEKEPFKYKNVKYINLPSNDSWARDTAPLFLKNSEYEQKGIDFIFNAYNGIYKDFKDDNQIAGKLCEWLNIPCEKMDLIFEGGAIATNGHGVALITEEFFHNRKNNLDKNEFSEIVKTKLGINKLVFLKNGLCFDETTGHIDEIATFCNEKEVVLAWTDDSDNPNFYSCRENFEILCKELPDFVIHKVILPNPLKRRKSEEIKSNENLRGVDVPIAVSYINYLCCKDFVLLPQFGIDEDKIACKQLKIIFPNKKIIPFSARELALGGGGIHCVTKNI